MTQNAAGTPNETVRIRKYANRRLYNRESSAFVTLSDLSRLVKEGIEFVVEDANSGVDLTSSVLIQIIAEEEAKGEHLLPLAYLRQLIRFYGEDMSQYVSTYLEQTLQAFTHNQSQFVDQMQEMFVAKSPVEQIARQNMALFKSTVETFANMSGLAGANVTQKQRTADNVKPGKPVPTGAERDAEVAELKASVDALRRRIDELDA